MSTENLTNLTNKVSIFRFMSSTAQGQVDEFVKRFKNLKEDFDRGMRTQIVLRLETLLNHGEQPPNSVHVLLSSSRC